MLLWMVTVAAGVYLLAAGRPARAPAGPAPTLVPAAEPAGAAQAPGGPQAASVPQAGGPQAASVPRAGAPPVGGPQAGGPRAGAPRTAGVPQAAAMAYAAGAAVPPITHTRITTRPGEHPLLEFMHPALGVAGLGCWIAFVITRFGVFAWVAFGVIIVTIAAGLTWYTVNARAARAERSGREPARRDGTGEPDAAEPGTGEPGTAEPGTGEPGTDGVRARARRYPARRLLVHGSAAAVTFVLALVTALAAHHA